MGPHFSAEACRYVPLVLSTYSLPIIAVASSTLLPDSFSTIPLVLHLSHYNSNLVVALPLVQLTTL